MGSLKPATAIQMVPTRGSPKLPTAVQMEGPYYGVSEACYGYTDGPY